MKTLDTRDLLKRKNELEDLRDAIEAAKDELHDHQEERPDGDAWKERLEELQDKLESAQEDFGDDEKQELEELEELESEISDFSHGETMIEVDDFEEYAQELAEDCGMIDRDANWPLTCIDWKQAAKELSQDFTLVTYHGTDYYVRA